MAFDPSIISAIPDYAGNPVNAQAKALTIKDMMDRQQLNELNLGRERDEEKERRASNEILKRSDYSTPQGVDATAAELNRVSPRAAMDFKKNAQSYQSGQVQQQLDQLKLFEARQDLIVQAIDPIVAQARAMKNKGASDLEVNAYISQQMPQALQGLRQMQMPDGKPALPDDVLKMATTAKHDLPTLEAWEGKSKQGAAMLKARREQMELDIKGKAETRQQAHETEIERHNRAMEAGRGGAGDFGGPVGQVLAAMSDIGIALPTGLRAKQQMLGTIHGLLERHPDDTADQIAQRVKAGQMATGAEKTEANVVARREGSAAAAINALNRDGGLYDQVLEVGKKVDFGSAKFKNSWDLFKQGKVIADPDISEYINALADTRAEFASVLARGGQVTDSVRIAAEHAFPDNMSYPELQRNVERSKKIAASIQAGNTAVIDAIVNGKSMEAALKSPAGAGASPAASPSGGAKAPAGGSLAPGQVYEHKSGAKVEILPDGA